MSNPHRSTKNSTNQLPTSLLSCFVVLTARVHGTRRVSHALNYSTTCRSSRYPKPVERGTFYYTYGTTGSYYRHSLRRGGRRLGWHAKFARLTSRCIWTAAGPRHLELARPSRENQLQGAKGDTLPVGRKLGKTCGTRRAQERPHARR